MQKPPFLPASFLPDKHDTMNDDVRLPDNDPDRLLAQQLGALLDQSVPLDAPEAASSVQDPLFDTLRTLKKQDAENASIPTDVSARLWAHLEEHVAADRAPQRPVRFSQTARIYRLWIPMAASFLLAIVLGWLLFFQTPDPVLVATADTETVQYTAPDGSVISLRAHSALYAVETSETALHYKLEGEGFFDVTKNENRVFTIEANDMEVAVLGTRFNVSTWGQQTETFLEEGQVRCKKLSTQETAILAPGQRCAVTAAGFTHDTDLEAADDYLDWMQGELTFQQRSLHRILAELEHHYAITFDVPASLLNETVTGRVLLGEPSQALNDLGFILEGRFVSDNESTFRFVPN